MNERKREKNLNLFTNNNNCFNEENVTKNQQS